MLWLISIPISMIYKNKLLLPSIANLLFFSFSLLVKSKETPLSAVECIFVFREKGLRIYPTAAMHPLFPT